MTTSEFIMIHVTKTGGSSLRSIILPGSPTFHMFARDFSAEKFRSAFTFGFVRNPYDRWASSYAHHCGSRYHGTLLNAFPDLKEMSFEQYLREVIIPSKRSWGASMCEVLRHPECGLPDFIGRFENYEADANRVLSMLGHDGVKVPHVNSNGRKDYSGLLGKTERRLIEGRFWEDFEEFFY